jgi:glycosyltransferase involved in cell wall biosynthesis
MRVLLHTRPDWRELPGGDLVQLQRWATWLGELGVQVHISDAAEPDLAGIDLLHLTNLGRAFALWPTLVHCRRQGVPVAFTPLYWPIDEYERRGRPGALGRAFGLLPAGIRQRLKAAARWSRQPQQRRGLWREIRWGSTVLNRRFLAACDAIIPTSAAEAVALRELLPSPPPLHLVRIGVDAVYWSDDRRLWALENRPLRPGGAAERPDDGAALTPADCRHQERNGILCVGRFDPQKSQHRLIAALRDLDVPLTFAGPDNPNYPGYRELCRRLAPASAVFLPRQSAAGLKQLYRACRVHALVSWYETTGLTGLEAGCQGAKVVVTSRGGTADYYGDRAWYADPADAAAMRRAVEAALAAPKVPDLATHVRRHFTWEQSARRLRQVFETVLANPIRRAA